MERNLTTGSVLKNLMFFSLPYLLSYFLQTLYGMADQEKNLTDQRQYGDLILHCLCGDDGIFPLHGAANRGCDVHAGRSSGGNGSVSDDLFCWYSVYHSI